MRYQMIFLVLVIAIFMPIADAAEHPLHQLQMPPGFKIEVFSAEVPNARQLTYGDKGTIFVGSRKAGNVYALQDLNRDHKAERIIVIAENLNMPSGIAFKNGALYVAAVNQILRYDNIEAQLEDPPKPVLITDKLPDISHHGWKNIVFGPDGFLYVPVGAPCNTCLEKNPVFAAILRMHPETGAWTIYAHGIRNSVGQAWHPRTGELWFTDNGRDWWGDDKPPCEINRAIRAGQHFGFPFFYGDDLRDNDFKTGKNADDFVKPALNLRAHVAPLGMLFYTGDMFPAKYKNQIIYAEHGSWNRSTPIGYRVAAVFINKDSQVTGSENLISGWLQNNSPWGRPVAPLQMSDGSLLISDDYAGAVYRLSYIETI